MSKKKENKNITDVVNHIDQSDKVLKDAISKLFEFANGEPVTVHVISDQTEEGVYVEIRSTNEDKTLLYQEAFKTSDDRIYPLKVNSTLHILLKSSLQTILAALTPQEAQY